MQAPELDVGVRQVRALGVALRQPLQVLDRGRPLALPLGRDPDKTRGRAGRPPRQSLAETLERHSFLRYDVLTDRLSVPAGEHRVASDLAPPERVSLHLDQGAALEFAPGTVLVAGALRSHGTAERPVTLRAADRDRGFDGVLVLGTAGPSKLEHTTFEGATGISRGPWQVSGGVTFRASPVELFDCSVLDARGEASAAVDTQGPFPPAFAGIDLDVVALILDPGTGAPRHATAPVTVQLVP